MIYQLVLVSEIHLWIEKGWRLTDDKVHVAIGGPEWASVYMEKDD